MLHWWRCNPQCSWVRGSRSDAPNNPIASPQESSLCLSPSVSLPWRADAVRETVLVTHYDPIISLPNTASPSSDADSFPHLLLAYVAYSDECSSDLMVSATRDWRPSSPFRSLVVSRVRKWCSVSTSKLCLLVLRLFSLLPVYGRLQLQRPLLISLPVSRHYAALRVHYFAPTLWPPVHAPVLSRRLSSWSLLHSRSPSLFPHLSAARCNAGCLYMRRWSLGFHT